MPIKTHPVRRWASLDEAAAYLAVHPRTLRRMIADGRVPGYRYGRRLIRIDLNELDARIRPMNPTGGGHVA